MNDRSLSEVQENTELPEIYFHSANFSFDRVITPAKRSNAHLWPQIGREDARSPTAFQEKAVRGKKGIFMTEALLYLRAQPRRQCQDVDEIRYPENCVKL
jgi:hypothetical protein